MIFVMSSLLALKSVQLVRAAVSTNDTTANVVSTAEAATPAEHATATAGPPRQLYPTRPCRRR